MLNLIPQMSLPHLIYSVLTQNHRVVALQHLDLAHMMKMTRMILVSILIAMFHSMRSPSSLTYSRK
jgi:hypothetical protein